MVALAIAPGGCTDEREREAGSGMHPIGWAEVDSGTFHGDDLRERQYPLAECRACHGEDYAGGPVSVSCTTGGCHEKPGGPEFCGTCHGDAEGPMPANGRHATHAAFCGDCHQVPSQVSAAGHIDGTVDVVLTGLAAAGGRNPTWDEGSRSCSDVHCHQGDSPSWDDATPLSCSGCHDTPAIHARFARVVNRDTCAGCHRGSPATGHLDGVLELDVEGCTGCHGASNPAPPTALDGATDPGDRAVGAHQRHVDASLPDRMGKAVACAACHVVPDELDSPGHLDDSAPAEVDVVVGDYEPVAGTCTVWCHGDASPAWTDDSGAARACGACHGFPPETTFSGGPHPTVAADPDACLSCHDFTPATHVDGEVTLK